MIGLAAARLIGYRWRTAVLPLAAGLAAVSLGSSVALTGGSGAAYFVTHTRVWELAAGGILALLAVRWSSCRGSLRLRRAGSGWR